MAAHLSVIDDMGEAPPPSAKIHICSSCGTSSQWDVYWSWFGSYGDIDDGVPVLKFCSTACADKMPEVRAARAKSEANARGDKVAEEVAEIDAEEYALKQQMAELRKRRRNLKPKRPERLPDLKERG